MAIDEQTKDEKTNLELMDILEFPTPNLRNKAELIKIEEIKDPQFQKTIDIMFKTMYEAPGVGLAGTQVDLHKSIAVIDISEEKNQPIVIINPIYTPIESAGKTMLQEGCLSVPGFSFETPRWNQVKLKALDRDGKEFEMHCEGLMAQCVQHECDHLLGKLYIDYLSNLKRDRVKKALQKKHLLEAKYADSKKSN